MARYGWVVSANPLGQMIAAPLFGLLYQKTGSARLVGLTTSVAYVAGSILYSILSVFPEDYQYPLLLFSRFVVGACAGKPSKQEIDFQMESRIVRNVSKTIIGIFSEIH